MRMIEDVAHEAFLACRAGDEERMRAAVGDIVAGPAARIDNAFQLWMDRVMIVAVAMVDSGSVNFSVEMVSDNSGTGQAEQLNTLIDELAWIGRMFAAYANRDLEAWLALRMMVPPGQEMGYVTRMLTTMTKTAVSYEENPPEPVTCCEIHEWIWQDPAATCARVAKAHLN